MTHDLQKYKEAKALLPHLETIIKVLNLTIKSLSYYQHFIPVYRILSVINNQKYILELERDRYKYIKSTKGLHKINNL